MSLLQHNVYGNSPKILIVHW